MNSSPLTTGELQAALSNAMIRVKHDFYGRGPASARTFLFDEYVFSVLDDVFTPAEHALIAIGEGELVRAVRMTFEDVMTSAFVEPVQDLTGRTVVAYHSLVLIEAGCAFEIFVLDPEQEGVREPQDAIAEVKAAHLDEPGEVGDIDELPSPGEQSPPASDRSGGERSGQGGGALRAALSNAVVRQLHERYGKGAARARTYVTDGYVFCALEGILTTVERTLVRAGEPNLVRHVRQRFQAGYGSIFAQEVQRLVGREVVGCETQIVFDPDTLFLIFQLGGEVEEGGAAA